MDGHANRCSGEGLDLELSECGPVQGVRNVRAEGVQGFMGGPEAQRVTVVDGRMTQVDLQFDTGIR